jgi:hypothetical protein
MTGDEPNWLDGGLKCSDLSLENLSACMIVLRKTRKSPSVHFLAFIVSVTSTGTQKRPQNTLEKQF